MPKGLYIRRIKRNPIILFTKKVLKTDGCWIWIGAKDKNGYGRFLFNNSLLTAHRASYILKYEVIAEGKDVHHTCGNPSCVNPEHLKALTRKQHSLLGNGMSAINSKKTLCLRGHKLTFDQKYKRRYCKECDNMRKRLKYQQSTKRKEKKLL